MTSLLVKLMPNPVPISYVVTLHSRRPPTAKLSIMPLQKKPVFMVALVTLCYQCIALMLYACKSKVIRLEMNPCPSISKINLEVLINIQLCKRDPVAQLVGARYMLDGVKIIMVSLVHSTERVNLKTKKKIKKQQRRKRQKKRQLKRRRRQKQRLLQTRKQPKLIAVTKKKKLKKLQRRRRLKRQKLRKKKQKRQKLQLI